MEPDRTSTPTSVRAQVNYLWRTPERPFAHVGKPPDGVPSRQEKVHPVEVDVLDARPLGDSFDLHREGFVLRPHRSAVTDFRDEAQVRDIYYPEMAALVRDAVGAREAVAYGRTLRAAASSALPASDPVRAVHNDYSPASGSWLPDENLPAEEALRRKGRRFVQVNVWRPMVEPLDDAPLALCDARSVAAEDQIVADLIYPDRVSQTLRFAHAPGHRWYYFPRMGTDEVLMFKCFDSDPDAPARFTPHTAFDNPLAPPDAPARQSIEVRVLAFF